MANPFINTSLSYSIVQDGIAVFDYRPPISHWLADLKFNRNLQLAPLLGALISQRLAQEASLPEIILPIPLHWRRLCWRGFNQSIEIARWPSKKFSLPIHTQLLQRQKATQPQTLLSKQERHNNLAGAFYCKKNLKPQHIALFDDVITTGSTILAAYETLKKEGVKKVSIWCCARAMPKEDH